MRDGPGGKPQGFAGGDAAPRYRRRHDARQLQPLRQAPDAAIRRQASRSDRPADRRRVRPVHPRLTAVRRFLSVLLCLFCASPVLAQQATRVPVEQAGRTIQLAAQLYRPASPQPLPAVAIFHGCGGVGVNNTRMAELLKSWGYVALVVDSFSARSLKDVCGRNWPTQAAAEARAHDIDAALAWRGKQSFVGATRLALPGYSYGGGGAELRPRAPRSAPAAPT